MRFRLALRLDDLELL